jgi:hypothetical protein
VKENKKTNGFSRKINMNLTDLWLKPNEFGTLFFHYLKIVAIEQDVGKDQT